MPEAFAAAHARLSAISCVGSITLMTHFANQFPQFHLDILRANTDVLTQMLRERQADAVVVDLRSLRPAPDLVVSDVHELEGTFLCRPGHPLLRVRRLTPSQVWAYPLASTPLSDELARILVERYGASAHPSGRHRGAPAVTAGDGQGPCCYDALPQVSPRAPIV